MKVLTSTFNKGRISMYLHGCKKLENSILHTYTYTNAMSPSRVDRHFPPQNVAIKIIASAEAPRRCQLPYKQASSCAFNNQVPNILHRMKKPLAL